MPSSKKRVLKDLYLASSIGELNSLADPDIPANKNANPLLFCNSADKVFIKATDYDVENDEENAFVFYMRYFKIVSLIKSTTKYKQDKAHCDKLLGLVKPRKAIDRAEKLEKSLTKRYEEARKQKEDEEMAKRLLQEEEDAKAKAAKANITNSEDNDLDDLLNNPGISSSSQLFQKLKVSHSSVLKPQGADTTNGDIHSIFETPSPLLPGIGVVIPCMTAEDLYLLTKREDSTNMMIIDIRARDQFVKNHILHSSCINVPAEMLEHGVSVSNIERRLLEKTRLMWRQRGNKQHIILLDKSTKVSEISPQSLVQQLKDAIYKYDSHCTLQKEPLILDGGFDSWLWHYPSLATRSELPKVSSSTSIPEVTDLSSLDYPELPEDKDEKQPSIIPQATIDLPNNEHTNKDIGGVNSMNGLYPTMPGSIHDRAIPSPGQQSRVGADYLNPADASGLQSPGGQTAMPSLFPGETVPVSADAVKGQRGIVEVPGTAVQHPGNAHGIKSNDSSLTGQVTVNRTINAAVAPQSQHIPLKYIPGQPTSVPAATGSTIPFNISGPNLPGLPNSVPNSIPPVSHTTGLPTSGIVTSGGFPQTSPKSSVPPPVAGQPPSLDQSRGRPSSSVLHGHPPMSVVNGPASPRATNSDQSPNNQKEFQLPTVKQRDNSTVYAELVFPNKPGNTPGNKTPQGDGSLPGNQVVNKQVSLPSNHSQKPGNQGGVSAPGQPQGTKASGYVTTAGFPLGWEKSVDQSTGRIFYRDHNTKTTHWTPPAVVPGVGVQPRSVAPQRQVQPQPNTIPGQQPTTGQPQVHQQRAMQLTPPHSVQQGQHPSVQQPRPSAQPMQPPLQQPHTLPTSQQHRPPTSPHTPKPFTPSKTEQPKSGLRRSLSSPNLAKLEGGGFGPLRPQIDRSSKPSEPTPSRPSFNRSRKPLTTLKLEALNPVHGGIGCGLTGLRNLGNTCYMNSVLQCLFSTAPLSAYFVSGAFREDINKENPLGTRGELAEQFSILVRATNSGQYKSLSPSEFKRTIGGIKPSFAGYDQQDSQEFLALMMDKLHEDVNRIRHKPYLKAPEDDIDPAVAAEITWSNHKKRNESMMLNLFDGMFKSTVCCLTCKKESVTFETFSNLTLPLPSNRNHCSLQDCINMFTRPERMSGDDKWYCPRCKQHREASKQLQIWRVPPILVIHLKRFQYDGMWRQKLQTSVAFPCDHLDISGYVAGPRPRSPYHLYGVSNHYGTMHGGHYTAFCKSSHNKRWYKFDDQLVTEMASKDIMTSAAYLLFYTSFEFTPPKLI